MFTCIFARNYYAQHRQNQHNIREMSEIAEILGYKIKCWSTKPPTYPFEFGKLINCYWNMRNIKHYGNQGCKQIPNNRLARLEKQACNTNYERNHHRKLVSIGATRGKNAKQNHIFPRVVLVVHHLGPIQQRQQYEEQSKNVWSSKNRIVNGILANSNY